jgi:heme exporter protein D
LATCGRSTPGARRFPREGGYITFFVLSIAAAIFLALGAAMQANACLRDANRRQAQQLQARAAEITVRP